MAKDGSSDISLSYQYLDILGKSAVRNKNAYAQVRHLCGDGVSPADGASALPVKQNENSEVDL
jgi:hypothetical protein